MSAYTFPTATQNVLLVQETDSSPVAFDPAADHAAPSNVYAVPFWFTAMQKLAVGHDTEVRPMPERTMGPCHDADADAAETFAGRRESRSSPRMQLVRTNHARNRVGGVV